MCVRVCQIDYPLPKDVKALGLIQDLAAGAPELRGEVGAAAHILVLLGPSLHAPDLVFGVGLLHINLDAWLSPPERPALAFGLDKDRGGAESYGQSGGLGDYVCHLFLAPQDPGDRLGQFFVFEGELVAAQ